MKYAATVPTSAEMSIAVRGRVTQRLVMSIAASGAAVEIDCFQQRLSEGEEHLRLTYACLDGDRGRVIVDVTFETGLHLPYRIRCDWQRLTEVPGRVGGYRETPARDFCFGST